ncbi:MAG: type II toxin-antitoxin system RelE/ParE family toxin [Chloroflexi bacterium]|nr:type II toxin-antitoxin system RelE/ParE family toxin [Chloroflexota bacterium]
MSLYRVWVEASARGEILDMPGNVRQRVRRAVAALADQPRPNNSRPLTSPEGTTLELRRIRIDDWRVVYAIDEEDSSVGVYAVRCRPPYNYSDLAELLGPPV